MVCFCVQWIWSISSYFIKYAWFWSCNWDFIFLCNIYWPGLWMNALCDKLYCCLITKFISYQTGFKLVQIYLNCFTCFWAVNWIYILQAWSRCRVCPFASRFQNSHWYFRNKEDSPWFDHLSHHAKLAEIINMVGKYMNKPFSNLSKSDLSDFEL